METSIKVRATLVRASKMDVFTAAEIPKENKLLFYRDPITHLFTDTYKILGTDAYAIIELYRMLQLGILYKLTDQHHENDFCFKLILRPAGTYDFFDTPKWVKVNTVYYVRNNNEVHGPHILPEHADITKLNSGIEKGILYVPDKQIFEPYKIKKSA